MFRAKTAQRTFKKGLDSEDARRKREDFAISLRRTARDEQLQKRRLNTEGKVVTDETPTAAAADKHIDIRSHMSELGAFVNDCHSEDMARQLNGVTMLRKLLSLEHQPPIQAVIDAGVVPRLVQMLTFNHSTEIQFEAAWTLTNIASGNSAQTRVVVAAGAVPHIVHLLRSPSEDLREQCVWCLGNIAGDSYECRDLVLKCGAIEPLVALIRPEAKVSMIRNATWAVSNLCRGKPQPDFRFLAPAVPKLAQLLHSTDDEVLADACWALSYLSDDKGDANLKINAVVESGVCSRLSILLLHTNEKIRVPALRTVGNIVTGDDKQTQAMLDERLLQHLLPLLQDPKRSIRKEACWTISNVTAGTADQISAVINANVIPSLIECLRKGEWEVRKEAAWAVSNATSGGHPKHIRYLVEQAAIPALAELLTCHDAKIVMVALEGLENILKVGKSDARDGHNRYADLLEECDGLDHLEALQRHDNEDVYEKSLKIIQTYFDAEDDETIDLGSIKPSANPAAAPAPFTFGGPAAITTTSTSTAVAAPQFQFNFSSF